MQRRLAKYALGAAALGITALAALYQPPAVYAPQAPQNTPRAAAQQAQQAQQAVVLIPSSGCTTESRSCCAARGRRRSVPMQARLSC